MADGGGARLSSSGGLRDPHSTASFGGWLLVGLGFAGVLLGAFAVGFLLFLPALAGMVALLVRARGIGLAALGALCGVGLGGLCLGWLDRSAAFLAAGVVLVCAGAGLFGWLRTRLRAAHPAH